MEVIKTVLSLIMLYIDMAAILPNTSTAIIAIKLYILLIHNQRL